MQQETTCSHGPKRKPLPTNDEESIVYELTSGLRGCYCSDAVGRVGEASTDGKVWFLIGSHTADINPLQVGLVAGQTLRGKIVPANFEYFEVHSLP
jgi:hypothetical protein